jgi:hypothetical protein
MNKQIRLLAEQAGMYVDLNGKPWPKWMGAEECEAAYARFAELIVREMLVTCEDHPAWTGRMIGEQIKQHFGVEE